MSIGWVWFFSLVGLLAFLFSIPMAVVANILTPKVLNWWATTSTDRRRKRISELSAELAEMVTFDEEDWRDHV